MRHNNNKFIEFLKVLWWVLSNPKELWNWAIRKREGYPRREEPVFILHEEGSHGCEQRTIHKDWLTALRAPLRNWTDRYSVEVESGYLDMNIEGGYCCHVRDWGPMKCSGFYYPGGKIRSLDELKALSAQNPVWLTPKGREDLSHCILIMSVNPNARTVQTAHDRFHLMEPEDQVV